MNPIMRLAGGILPLVGLAGIWGWTDHLSRQGTEWDVLIVGYDPRDYLRGHYVEYSYDWPYVDPVGRRLEFLCLEGEAPVIKAARQIEDNAGLADCLHPVRANPAGVYGPASLERGRLYVGQDRARRFEQGLGNREQRGLIRIRLRDDGTITPIDIRFRPLTVEEQAEREEERARREREAEDGAQAVLDPLAVTVE
jgi:hypothetical protein